MVVCGILSALLAICGACLASSKRWAKALRQCSNNYSHQRVARLVEAYRLMTAPLHGLICNRLQPSTRMKEQDQNSARCAETLQFDGLRGSIGGSRQVSNRLRILSNGMACRASRRFSRLHSFDVQTDKCQSSRLHQALEIWA
ncbi:hypothetical protein BS50DRAFT_180354 [Corynespora cassiicola Philippines]|uniref:Secreted protein n=1 Tax=Corynespora cassiicola Philippines TaxID=1448308 RepID=A0A2T2P697_CORCC|nr:hypothetical protein BS50DRAFT_180354 [Corynespora cassiicola Philippines]